MCRGDCPCQSPIINKSLRSPGCACVPRRLSMSVTNHQQVSEIARQCLCAAETVRVSHQSSTSLRDRQGVPVCRGDCPSQSPIINKSLRSPGSACVPWRLSESVTPAHHYAFPIRAVQAGTRHQTRAVFLSCDVVPVLCSTRVSAVLTQTRSCLTGYSMGLCAVKR